MWIFTREDILQLNTTCNFLTQWYLPDWKNAGMVREYMSSLSIYRNTWCVILTDCSTFVSILVVFTHVLLCK